MYNMQNVTITGICRVYYNALHGIQASNFTGKVYRILVSSGVMFTLQLMWY